MIENYKNYILLSSLITLFGLGFILIRWPYGLNRTFSQHIARKRTSIIYYIALALLVVSTLLTYIFGWFVPTFNPSPVFSVFILLAATCHVACTLIPETGGLKSQVHRFFAFVSAISLLPATIMIALMPNIGMPGRVAAAMSSLLMPVVMAIFIKTNAEHKYLLVLQASHFASFFITLLVVTYL